MLRRHPFPVLSLLSLCALTAGCAFPPGPYNIDHGPATTYTTTPAPAVAGPAFHTRARAHDGGNPLHAQAPLTSDQIDSRDRNCGPFGVPVLGASWGFGETDFVGRHGYFLQHSAADKIPVWVCERVDPDQIDDQISVNRPGWQAEPQLQPGRRAEDDDYKPWTNPQTGVFDRGHMCPNADFDTKAGRDETFFLSNVVPQDKGCNQHIWATLEGDVRTWILARGTSYIITGPMFYDPKDDPSEPGYKASQNDGVTNYYVIGVQNEVAVPTHVYKIVLAPKPGHPDQWESIAVVLENRNYPSPYPLAANLRSINWIEQRTGINFFPNLDSDPGLEQQLEGQKAPALW